MEALIEVSRSLRSPVLVAGLHFIKLMWVSGIAALVVILSLFQGWSPIKVHIVATGALFAILSYAGALAHNGLDNFDGWLSRITDFQVYERSTAFDAIFAHYNHLATVGLLLTLLIYGSRQFAAELPILVSLVASIMFFAIMSIYSLQFAKLALRLAVPGVQQFGVYFVLVILIFFIDAVALGFFIRSVPLDG